MTTVTTLTKAEEMGRRAGELYRETAVPQPCPFDEQHPDTRDAWIREYVVTAYS